MEINSLTHNFTEAGVSDRFSLKAGESATYAVTTEDSGFFGVIALESSETGEVWRREVEADGSALSGLIRNESSELRFYRFVAEDIDESNAFDGDVDATIQDAEDTISEWRDKGGNPIVRITDAGLYVFGDLHVSGDLVVDGEINPS